MFLSDADGHRFVEADVNVLPLFPEDMVLEEWRDVPSLPGLQASSWGRVRGTAPGSKLKPTFGTVETRGGHRRMKAAFTLDGKRKTVKVHLAVCEAFHGPHPTGEPYVAHLDEDGTNNLPDNLKWSDHKENMNAPKFVEGVKQRRAAGIFVPRKRGQLPLPLQETMNGCEERAAQAL